MTTLAALFGALPLMLSTGTGAELRQPLGLVMVGGLLLSQVLTLFTTPVIYLLFDRLSRRWRGVREPAAGAASWFGRRLSSCCRSDWQRVGTGKGLAMRVDTG